MIWRFIDVLRSPTPSMADTEADVVAEFLVVAEVDGVGVDVVTDCWRCCRRCR
jgi:hypothetical protein